MGGFGGDKEKWRCRNCERVALCRRGKDEEGEGGMEDWDQETLEKAIAREQTPPPRQKLPPSPCCIHQPTARHPLACCETMPNRGVFHQYWAELLRVTGCVCTLWVQRSTRRRTRTAPPRSSASSSWRRSRRNCECPPGSLLARTPFAPHLTAGLQGMRACRGVSEGRAVVCSGCGGRGLFCALPLRLACCPLPSPATPATAEQLRVVLAGDYLPSAACLPAWLLSIASAVTRPSWKTPAASGLSGGLTSFLRRTPTHTRPPCSAPTARTASTATRCRLATC